MSIILFLLLLGGAGYYFTKPEERARAGRALLAYVREQKEEALRRWQKRDEGGHPGGSVPIATVAIVVVNVLVFVKMLLAGAAQTDEATLVSWGANFGPRTTNGEWWRMVASTFVHSGFLHLVADLCGLVLIGILVEGLVGTVAFATVYLVAGTFASLVVLSQSPIDATVGASGAIAGIYGLVLALWLWSLIQRSPLRIPLHTLKALGSAAVLFLLYSAVTGRLAPQANLAGFISGFLCGMVLAIGSEERKPAVRRVAAVTAATALMAIGFAVPLRGLDDVRPAIAHIIALEGRAAAAYGTAVKRLTDGHIKAGTLAKLIDGTIAPEFQEAAARLKALGHVPAEQQPLIVAADQYLTLRAQSWRLRSDALHKSNMRALQNADRIEWQSLDAFQALKQIAAP